MRFEPVTWQTRLCNVLRISAEGAGGMRESLKNKTLHRNQGTTDRTHVANRIAPVRAN